jgi:peptide/nickel transport system substrate-binding protein
VDILHRSWHTGGVYNWSWFAETNPRVDELLDEAKVTIDDEARWALYKEFQMLVVDNVAAVFLGSETGLRTMRSTVGGYVGNPMMPFETPFYYMYPK